MLPLCVGVVACYLTWRYVPESRARERVLRRAATAAAWTLILLPLTLGIIAARLTGSWSNPVSLTAAAVGALGLVALALTWRGRMRANMMHRISGRKRHLLSVMLMTAATLSFGLTGYSLQLYGFFSVVQGMGPLVAGLALLPMLAAVVLTAKRASANGAPDRAAPARSPVAWR